MTRREALPNFYAVLDAIRWTSRRARSFIPALAFLLLVAYVIANARAGQALEQELSLVRTQGAPLTLREAAPPPVPDDQNAALVYEQAFERLPRLEKAPTVAEPRGHHLAQTDERTITGFLSNDTRRQQTVTTEQVRQALAGTEAALALVRKAAAMPRCRFPVNWEAGAGALFPHYPKLRSLSQLLAAHAILASMDGKPADRIADIQAIVGIARHTLAEHIMIGQLVAYQCLSTARNSLRRSMEVAPLTEPQSHSLYETWAEVDLSNTFERTIETERCLGLWVFDITRGDPAKVAPLIGNEGNPVLLPYRLGALGEPLRKLDELCYLRFMAREVGRAKQRGSIQPVDRSDDYVELPWYAAVSRLMLPAFARVTRKRNEAMAGLALIQWGLALDACRQRTGHFPASLKEAEELVGRKLPSDPFTGEALIYRPQDTGYLLYSVGDNRRDDGGQNRAATEPPTDGPDSPGQDDIAWQFG